MPDARIRRYLRHGTLPQLAVFEASARLRSFTRAAEELHLAQPTVSIQIRKLTETVGLPLFEQIGKQIFLTEAGRRLYRHCQAMFGGLGELEEAVAELRGLRSGRLRLAVGTVAQHFAPRMLARFLEQHPGLEAALEIHNCRALTERLARNDDELYLFANPPEDRDLVRQAILPNPMVVFARADHPLAQQRGITLERLAQEPLLMRESGSGTRGVVEAVFARSRLTPRVRMELGSNEAIKQAILAGSGVSILSRYTLELEAGQPELVTLDVEGFPLEQHWYFVYPVGRQPSLVASTFMGFVRERAQALLLEHVRVPMRAVSA